MPQQLTIGLQRRNIYPQQSAGKSRIAEMQHGGLDEPAETVAVPGREFLQQKHALQLNFQLDEDFFTIGRMNELAIYDRFILPRLIEALADTPGIFV